jgi:carbonic anhydrase
MSKPRVGKKVLVGMVCAALMAMSQAVYAESGHGGGHAAAAPAKTPVDTIKSVIKGNNEFVSHHNAQYFEPFQKSQAPSIVVVGCADSRVHTNLLGFDPTNNVFMIRNIGNQVVNAEGSVNYGILHLPTNVLLVMGHSSCGAVKAAMGDYSKETDGIKLELDPLKEPLKADTGEGSFDARWQQNIERNVDYQVSYALKLYAGKVKDNSLVVLGAVYDFNNFYGKGKGTLVITNVNGETNPNKIMSHPALKNIPAGDLVAKVGSLAPDTVYDPALAHGETPCGGH